MIMPSHRTYNISTPYLTLLLRPRRRFPTSPPQLTHLQNRLNLPPPLPELASTPLPSSTPSMIESLCTYPRPMVDTGNSTWHKTQQRYNGLQQQQQISYYMLHYARFLITYKQAHHLVPSSFSLSLSRYFPSFSRFIFFPFPSSFKFRHALVLNQYNAHK